MMKMIRQPRLVSALIAIVVLSACGSQVKFGGALPPANGAAANGSKTEVDNVPAPPLTETASPATVPAGTSATPPPAAITNPQRPSRLNPLPSVPAPSASTIVIDVLQNRHTISPLIYGANFPPSTSYVTDGGVTLVRWGGNASTRYNWKNFDTNAANDWYFQNRPMDSNSLYQDSTNFVSSISGAGAVPIMTIGMLPWVAKDGNASSYSFSVKTYGAQCGVNPYYADDGNGVKYSATCNSSPVYITGNLATDAHVPLLDSPGSSDPAGSVYRNQWVAALAPKFGSQPHWYNMDNEMDIWAGTHRDVHPNAVTYDEMRNTFLAEARAVKNWDPSAVRLGPVSCCWWFYWNDAAGTSKATHGGVDLLPWWLNEVYWADQIAGNRSLDVLDLHAYPEAGTSGDPLAKIALRVTRDFWDSTYVAEPGTSINQNWATQTQPNKTIPFRIPRMRAILNATYPGTPLSFTEWNASFVKDSNGKESDFSNALVDVDAYGIFGREHLYAATRWVAADPTTPPYQALKLYRNYDGQHHSFGSISIAANQSADPNLFSSYAAIDPAGTTVTVMLVNKDPSNSAQKTVAISGFNASQVQAYTLSQSSPTAIVAGSPQAWTETWNLAPYSATLLVITGSMVNTETTEWELNPDVIQIPASGTTMLQPRITSASGSVTFSQVTSDSGITVALTQPRVDTSQNGALTVNAGATPGFYRFAVTGMDNNGVTQTQQGWILVGNPAASLIKTGDGQSATRGTTINLSVQISVGNSGGASDGASILFTTDQGTLSAREVQTNSSGVAAVQLTLPNVAGTAHVTAEGPIGLGHPVVTFSETSQ